MTSCEAVDLAVTSALEANAVAVVQTAPGHWRFAIEQHDDAEGVEGVCRVDDHWVTLSCALPGASPRLAVAERAMELLLWNGSLPGGAKLCVVATGLRAAVELPVVDGAALHMAAAVDGLRAAVTRVEGGAFSDATPAVRTNGVDLLALCAETQWTCKASAPDAGGPAAGEPDAVLVQLDDAGACPQAEVRLLASGGVRASLVLAESPVSAACSHAQAVLLLRATGAVRMLRAARDSGEGPARFEFVWAEAPTALELGHTLAALSVAWRLAGREAGLVGAAEAVALAYLARQQWDSRV